MSAVFKNAKKKVSQTELRRFMNEQKNKVKAVQKIDSPLAKYTDNGQLMCILCKSIVRSEAVWKVHINTKQHRENIDLAKKLKQDTSNFTAFKRPASPDVNVPAKKPRSILKNATSISDNIPDDFFDSDINNITQNIEPAKETSTSQEKYKIVKKEQNEKVELKNNLAESLPEGFFDDPKLDAKVRHLDYKDPVEEEWERFQKEIKEVDNKSAEIIAEDQEEATNERQIDEIEEQMRNWSRVLDLEKKKDVVKIATAEDAEMEEASDEDDENFNEFLDWRSKNSFK